MKCKNCAAELRGKWECEYCGSFVDGIQKQSRDCNPHKPYATSLTLETAIDKAMKELGWIK